MTARHQLLEHPDGVRECWQGSGSLVTTWGSAIVIFGSIALDIQQPGLGFKLGNVIFMLACISVIALRCLFPPRTASEVSAPSEYDLLIALGLLWGAYSIVHSGSREDALVHTFFAATLWFTVLCVKSGRLGVTLRLIFWCAAAVSALCIITGQLGLSWAFQPNSSTGYPELRGILEHQLKLGMLTGAAVVIVFVALANGELNRLRGRCPPLVFGAGVLAVLVALYESFARSPTGALVLTLACCGSFAPRRLVRYASLAVVVAGVAIYWLYADQVLAMIFTTESDLTFSGRIKIWEGTLEHAALNPWIGYGTASFGTPQFDFLWVNYRPPSAHNSFLQAYFETGYVGLALTVGLVAALIVRGIYTSLRWRRLSYTLFIALYGLFCSVMSVVFAGKPSVLFTLILLVAAQEAHALTQSRAAFGATRNDRRFLRAGAAGPVAGTQ